jgi:hypothetical protein
VLLIILQTAGAFLNQKIFVLDLIATACKAADDMETKMDCNPKCEKPYKLDKHNNIRHVYTHFQDFLLHQGYQDSDSNIIPL